MVSSLALEKGAQTGAPVNKFFLSTKQSSSYLLVILLLSSVYLFTPPHNVVFPTVRQNPPFLLLNGISAGRFEHPPSCPEAGQKTSYADHNTLRITSYTCDFVISNSLYTTTLLWLIGTVGFEPTKLRTWTVRMFHSATFRNDHWLTWPSSRSLYRPQTISKGLYDWRQSWPSTAL